MVFAGSYGTNNILIEGGGSYVGNDGSISLYGNVWKAFELDTPYEATGNTHISFDFELIEEAEGHALCTDEDTNDDTFGGSHKRCFAIAGTEYELWSDLHVKKTEKATIGTQTFSVKIGDIFPEIGTMINYIAFVQDNDNQPLRGISRIKNIKLFDVKPVSLIFLSKILALKIIGLTL